MRRFIVPANLLLAGEYAVTEPGGLGLALAIARHVKATIDLDRPFALFGRYGASEERRFRGPADGEELPDIAARTVCDAYRVDPAGLRGLIVIDSSAFYDEDGRKLGLGSSAAVAVAVCACVAVACGVPWSEAKVDLDGLANAAHREAQGGRGSGYDILASVHGGIGVVTGGEEPGWMSAHPSWLSSIGLRSQRQPIRTGSAIVSYERWKAANPTAHERFFDASNRHVRSLAGAKDFDAAKLALCAARDLGAELGDSIGVSAVFDPPAIIEDAGDTIGVPEGTIEESVCKALGAGNELVGCISRSERFPDGFTVETIDWEGARWL